MKGESVCTDINTHIMLIQTITMKALDHGGL